MQRSKSLVAGLIWATVSAAPAALVAQPADYAAPVPGPYLVMPKPPTQLPQAQTAGQAPGQAQSQPNPYSNPGFAQPMPYWMQPQQTRRGPAAPQAGQPSASSGRQTYIPGWVWSPYAPNTGPAPAPGYTPGFAPGYGPQPGQGFWPGYPAPGYANAPWGPRGANNMGQYGAPRQPQQ